jgi:hypothetical protein
LAWLKFGRDILPARTSLSIGSLLLEKFELYRLILMRRTAAQWVRTDRGKLE